MTSSPISNKLPAPIFLIGHQPFDWPARVSSVVIILITPFGSVLRFHAQAPFAISPPSTLTYEPVMNEALLLARNNTDWAISAG